MAFTCGNPSPKFSMEEVEENPQLLASPWEGKMSKHLSSLSDLGGTVHGTGFNLTCLGTLMGPSIL